MICGSGNSTQKVYLLTCLNLLKGYEQANPLRLLFMQVSLKMNCCVHVHAFKGMKNASKTFVQLQAHNRIYCFVSVNKPHKPIVSSTLSHWIKDCLLEAGVDSKVFKAHSTRGASTSAAARAGISIPEIINLGDWTRETTFKRFYYRPLWNEALNIHCYIEASIMKYNWRLCKGCLQYKQNCMK